MRASGRFAGYNRDLFRKDLIAGLIVGMIAIPLGMAFAIAIGVKPEYGLYTTIIAGIIIAICGGSRFQIGGPTGAFVPILLAIVLQYGYEHLLIAGFLSGIILVIMGLLRLGKAVQFIPRPVTIGFTAGIAVLIFSGQLPNVLGISELEQHEHFFSNLKELALRWDAISPYSVITAAICLVIIIAMQRWIPKIPGAFAGMIISSMIALLIFPNHVATIRSTYGAIPSTLPHFQWLNLDLQSIGMMLVPAFTIALLGGIESLLSAVVADRMSGTAHNSNRELIGQGLANIATPLFGGIPATGAIARTAANIKHGAVSPLSAVIHSLFVLLIVVLFAKFASDIPLASMAPILMIVAWNMSERHEFKQILRARSTDTALLLTTFILTLVTNLITAIWVGMLAAILCYLWHYSYSRRNMSIKTWLKFTVILQEDEPTHIQAKLQGVMSFITASQVKQTMLELASSKPKYIQLDMSGVPYVDTTGAALLHSLAQYVKSYGGKLSLSDLQVAVQQSIHRSDIQQFESSN